MALPRKGTRKLTVDEHALRWLVRPGKTAFLLVVEPDTDPGQKLVCSVPNRLFPRDRCILSPAIAAQCVRAGMAEGFDPGVERGEISLTITAEHLDFTAVDTEKLTP